jgi:hypothetical protein
MEHATSRETKGPARSAGALCQRSCLQRSAEREPNDARAAGLAAREVLAAHGEPMDDTTRASMERRFGRDFSTVRVHANPDAAWSASLLSARAYTVGEHVVFGAGQYAPASGTGARLLAHELGHVLQQRAGAAQGRAGTPGAGLVVSDPSGRHERAAEAAARTMAPPVAGGPAPATPFPAPPVTRAAAGVVQRFQAGEVPTAFTAGEGRTRSPALPGRGGSLPRRRRGDRAGDRASVGRLGSAGGPREARGGARRSLRLTPGEGQLVGTRAAALRPMREADGGRS